jgi:Ca2+-binding RTX toxin-like protein
MQVLHGTVNADVLRGKLDGENEIWGHGGDDNLIGGKADDVLIGGKGGDNLWGDRGDDRLIGDTGNDTLKGSVGDDKLYSGDGNDYASGGKNDDSVFGGKGDDTLYGNSGNDAMAGGTGDDAVNGGKGDDVMFGGWGADTVKGNSGDDFLMASKGFDALSGNSGFDTVDFSRMTGQLTLDLAKHSYTVGSGGNAGTVSGFEQVIAGNGGSHMMGDDAHDTIFVGGAGNDWMRGKAGSDTLTGGDGADTFAFLKKDTVGGGVDTITDFQVGVDHIDMADFGKGKGGIADAVRFTATDDGSTLVQGLVNKQWVDVVKLAGVDIHDAGYALLA